MLMRMMVPFMSLSALEEYADEQHKQNIKSKEFARLRMVDYQRQKDGYHFWLESNLTTAGNLAALIMEYRGGSNDGISSQNYDLLEYLMTDLSRSILFEWLAWIVGFFILLNFINV